MPDDTLKVVPTRRSHKNLKVVESLDFIQPLDCLLLQKGESAEHQWHKAEEYPSRTMAKHSSSIGQQQNGKKTAKAASAGRRHKPKVSAGRQGGTMKQCQEAALEAFKSKVLEELSEAKMSNNGRSAVDAIIDAVTSNQARQVKSIEEMSVLFQKELAKDGNLDGVLRLKKIVDEHRNILFRTPKKEEPDDDEDEVVCLGTNLVAAAKPKEDESEAEEETDDNDCEDDDDDDEEYKDDSRSDDK